MIVAWIAGFADKSIAMWAGRSEIDWRMKQALSFSYLKMTYKQTGKTKTAG